jgi:hypothetical protein
MITFNVLMWMWWRIQMKWSMMTPRSSTNRHMVSLKPTLDSWLQLMWWTFLMLCVCISKWQIVFCFGNPKQSGKGMKEPLGSKLTIPHASPLYHIGDNIFMKYNLVPLLKKLSPLQFFWGAILFMLHPIHVFTLTHNISKFHVNQSTNVRAGAIQVTTYWKI